MPTATTDVLTATDDSAVGSVAWTNTANAIGNDWVDHATASMPASGAATHYLVLGFEFTGGNALPPSVIIQGITLSLHVASETTSQIKWNVVRLRKAGVAVGTDKGDNSALIVDPTTTPTAWGGAADLWGTTWAASDFGAGAGFAVQLQFVHTGIDPTRDARVYGGTATVTYIATFNETLTTQVTVQATVTRAAHVSRGLTTAVTPRAAAAGPALPAQTTHYGRLLDAAGRPAARRPLTVAFDLPPTLAGVGADLGLAPDAQAAVTATDGTFRVAVTAADRLTPSTIRYRVDLPGEVHIHLHATGTELNVVTAVTAAEPDPWAALAVCQLGGSVVDLGAAPVVGMPVTATLDVPAGAVIATTDGSLVLPDPVVVVTAADGGFTLSLLAQARYVAPVVYRLTVGTATTRIVVPDQATAQLADLL